MTDALSRVKAALASRYAVERELGSGGTATVYLAEDLKHERQVAVKVLRPELAAALGDGENAVALWRQASAEGFAHPTPSYWPWIAFEPIRDYEPWQQLIRPKG